MMLTMILITIAVFSVAMVGMAIGVILSDRRIRGSCGGLSGLKDEQGNPLCDGCSNPSPDCTGEPLEQAVKESK